MNPNNLYRGQSVIEAAARAIDTDAHAADYNRRSFYNSATPDGTLQTDETLSDATCQRLKQEWDATYGGPENAHQDGDPRGGPEVPTGHHAAEAVSGCSGRRAAHPGRPAPRPAFQLADLVDGQPLD